MCTERDISVVAMCTEAMAALELVELTIGYERPLVAGINMSVKGPALVQVVGPNGAGKTTLLKTVAGLLKPLSGRVYIDGIDVTGSPKRAGQYVTLVPQPGTPRLSELFPISVWEFVEVGVSLCLRKRGEEVARGELKSVVREALKAFGIGPELWERSVWRLSGGQRQRVLLARAAACRAPVTLLDEPLAPIDPEGRVEAAELIGDIAREGLVVVTCHDPELLLKRTSLVVVLGRGSCLVGNPKEVLRAEVLAKFYGGAVIEYAEHAHLCDYHA